MNLPLTLGELKHSGYLYQTVKDELRNNLIHAVRNNQTIFAGILGYEDTVIPDVQRAILSRHNILFLGLRGQAKTKLARLMTQLLDEYIPVVKGSEINDHPLHPISKFAQDKIRNEGDDAEIEWIHRSQRYIEKLATPDVSVADLIGDLDPIKAANLKLPYSDERVLHFGLIPRSHRSIFVINELPDLQPRIQVGLFNILQEGDIQIRGFKVRLPLDILFVFTANPEDYTNRGSIITPLKDRIESQILTHYPVQLETSQAITSQEAQIPDEQKQNVYIPDLVRRILERISFKARDSEFVDPKSGVSARLSISGLENLYSTAELRMLKNKETSTTIRLTDFWGVIPSITGKIELVYEGEQEGHYNVAIKLLGQAIKDEFLTIFPHPSKEEKKEKNDLYLAIRHYFSDGNQVVFSNDDADSIYKDNLTSIKGLLTAIKAIKVDPKDEDVYMELILHALAEFNILNKEIVGNELTFNDILANMLDDLDEED